MYQYDIWYIALYTDDRSVCSLIHTCTLNGHLYRATYTRCHSRIGKINCPDDGHIAGRNMYRMEINRHEKELYVRLVIYKDYTPDAGQQNIKRLKMDS